MRPGAEIALKMDQTLTQDATGTLVMLELEAMGLDRVRTELSAQYVDHNLLQEDHKNPDDHEFLRSACQRFGVWYSRPGNGVSHPVHMQRFGKPGKTLVGSDSHTPAAGSLGMLAFGAGSGTKEDAVFLCSPETATASALAGRITDPRNLDMPYPKVEPPSEQIMNTELLIAPLPAEEAAAVELIKGPNIARLPEIEPIPDDVALPVLLRLGDDVSTDEISPAGGRALPFRSNIPKISDFAFDVIDESYTRRGKEVREDGGHAIVGGDNYGQGSSREHAALAPCYLGLRVVVAKSFARIHWQNLVNFGILPLTFADAADYDRIEAGDVIEISDLYATLEKGELLTAQLAGKNDTLTLQHDLSVRQIKLMRCGGIINWMRELDAGRRGREEEGVRLD